MAKSSVRSSEKAPIKKYSNRRINYLVNQKFQWRYTWYLLSTVVLATLLTGGVTAYFLNQNYGIFNRLAYLHAPDLLPQLEREQVWINTFLLAFFIALVSFNLLYGLKMTSRIAGPVMILRRHIRGLARGLFFQRVIRVRETDEFRDLIESYNYLYKSLRAQINRDIKKLEEAVESSKESHVREQLLSLLNEKKSQVSESDVEILPAHGSRHVS